MSRSRRYTPMRGITTASSEKNDKRSNNRLLRHKVRQAIHQKREVLPEEKEVSNPWNMSKDGKTRFDPKRLSELMRK